MLTVSAQVLYFKLLIKFLFIFITSRYGDTCNSDLKMKLTKYRKIFMK